MAFQTDRIQIDGSLNVDGSIYQWNQLFIGGGGGGTGDVAWASGNVGSNNQIITAAGDGSIVAESDLLFDNNTLYAQDSTSSPDSLTLRAGDNTSSGVGGHLTIRGGNAASNAIGGDVSISSGNSAGGANGASMTIISGYSLGGSGGALNLLGGMGAGFSGGNINIVSGNGSGVGGGVNIHAGTSSGDGGDVSIYAGAAGSGSPGSLYIGQNDTSAIYLGASSTIDTGTPGSNEVLYVDVADNFKLKRGTVASGLSWSGSTANGIATYGSSSTVVAESTLTYDGFMLSIGDQTNIGTDSMLHLSRNTGQVEIRMQRSDLGSGGQGWTIGTGCTTSTNEKSFYIHYMPPDIDEHPAFEIDPSNQIIYTRAPIYSDVGGAISERISIEDLYYIGATTPNDDHGFAAYSRTFGSADYQYMYYRETNDYGGLFHRQGTSYSDLRMDYNYLTWYYGTTGGTSVQVVQFDSAGMDLYGNLIFSGSSNRSIVWGDDYDLTIGGNGTTNGGDLILQSQGGSSSSGKINIQVGATGGTYGECVVNDDSFDSNFRVESNSYQCMLMVDAGQDKVFITTQNTINPTEYAKEAGSILELYNDSPYITITNTAETFAGIEWVDYNASSETAKFAWTCTAPNNFYWWIEDVSLMRLEETTGDLDVKGDVISYSSVFPSDIRLKENVETLPQGSLDKILNLRGVSYNKIGYVQTQIGYIAQELEEFIPEVVIEKRLPLETGDNDNFYKTIRYQEIIPVITEAMKEQQKIINDQQKEIDDLKEKVEFLMNRL